MEFYLGGRAQGKLDLVLQKYPNAVVLDEKALTGGKTVEDFFGEALGKDAPGACTADAKAVPVWNHVHLFVREWLSKGMEPAAIWDKVSGVIDVYPQMVILSDEIGNGIVPMDKEERRYREEAGRLQCKIAARADKVERVICGLTVRLK